MPSQSALPVRRADLGQSHWRAPVGLALWRAPDRLYSKIRFKPCFLSRSTRCWVSASLRVTRQRCFMNRNAFVAIFSLWMFLALSAFAQNSPVAAIATTSGAVLRSLAVSKLRPTYPQDALRQNISGVAVAQIQLTVEGKVETLDILQSPSPSIADAVRSALMQWQFQPSNGSEGKPPLRPSGKLVFYFEIQEGKGSVLFPEETGYVGRWSRTSGHSQVAAAR